MSDRLVEDGSFRARGRRCWCYCFCAWLYGVVVAQGVADDLIDCVDENHFELFADFGLDVLEVALVAPRQDDRLDSRAPCREHFLLDSADWEHFAAQRYLAGH